MKRNIFKIFSAAFLLSILFSCANEIDEYKPNVGPETEKARLVLSVDKSESRTIFPLDYSLSEMKYTLNGTKEGETCPIFTDKSHIEMTSDIELYVEAGTWTFTLSAKKGDVVAYTATLSNVDVKAGANPLSFSLQRIDTDGNGSLGVTLSWAYNANIKKAKAGLLTVDWQSITAYPIKEIEIHSDSGNKNTFATYEKDKVPSGIYVLVFKLYDGNDNEIKPGYSEIVHIKNGFNSNAKRNLSNDGIVWMSDWSKIQDGIGGVKLVPRSDNANRLNIVTNGNVANVDDALLIRNGNSDNDIRLETTDGTPATASCVYYNSPTNIYLGIDTSKINTASKYLNIYFDLKVSDGSGAFDNSGFVFLSENLGDVPTHYNAMDVPADALDYETGLKFVKGSGSDSRTLSATVEKGKIVYLFLARNNSNGGGLRVNSITVKEAGDTLPTLTLDKTSITGKEGDTITLTANVTGSSERVTWKSSDPKVVTVASTSSNSATVTVVGGGEARIMANVAGVTTECKVSTTGTLWKFNLVKLPFAQGATFKQREDAGGRYYLSTNGEIATVDDGTLLLYGKCLKIDTSDRVKDSKEYNSFCMDASGGSAVKYVAVDTSKINTTSDYLKVTFDIKSETSSDAKTNKLLAFLSDKASDMPTTDNAFAIPSNALAYATGIMVMSGSPTDARTLSTVVEKGKTVYLFFARNDSNSGGIYVDDITVKDAESAVNEPSLVFSFPDNIILRGEEIGVLGVTATNFNGEITWSSSDENVATVTEDNGYAIVNQVGLGNATITAKAGSVEKTVNVTVKAILGNEFDKTNMDQLENYLKSKEGDGPFEIVITSNIGNGGVRDLGIKTAIQNSGKKVKLDMSEATGLTMIVISAFEGTEGLVEVVLPETITAINGSSFKNCGLTSINIPKNVYFIGEGAFDGCSSLTSVTVNPATPPLSYAAFPDNVQDIFVPASSVEAYQSAEGWSSYAGKIKAITE